jgi:phosphoribosylformylglycinamidine synthase
VVTIRPEDKDKFESLLHSLVDATDYSVRFEKIGTVHGEQVIIDGDSWGTVADWKNNYDTALESHLV